jgi:hypothetical protein
MALVNPLPSHSEDSSPSQFDEDFQLWVSEMCRHAVRLLESDNVMRQVWGKHLLEDWKSLSLIADKLEGYE